jgi:hypothetical protein
MHEPVWTVPRSRPPRSAAAPPIARTRPSSHPSGGLSRVPRVFVGPPAPSEAPARSITTTCSGLSTLTSPGQECPQDSGEHEHRKQRPPSDAKCSPQRQPSSGRRGTSDARATTYQLAEWSWNLNAGSSSFSDAALAARASSARWMRTTPHIRSQSTPRPSANRSATLTASSRFNCAAPRASSAALTPTRG